MDLVLTVIVVVLGLNLGAAVLAAARARDSSTWILGVMLAGSTGAGILAVLSSLLATPALTDAALALMALALVAVVVRTGVRPVR